MGRKNSEKKRFMSNRQRQIFRFDKAKVEWTAFEMEKGTAEYHLMVHVTDSRQTFEEQLKALHDACDEVLKHHGHKAVPVFKRYFLSDVCNQAEALGRWMPEEAACAVSVIQQPPLNGTKVALWAYLMEGGAAKKLSENLYEVSHGAYRDLWTAGSLSCESGSESQTRRLLSDYVRVLERQGITLADHCLRTWFFVQDIDRNYAGVVKARNEVFLTQNLMPETHFIASTGIGGGNPQAESLVQLDALAVDGLQPGQVHYLYAKSHLNPTYEYGVSFERGTYVDYGDRRKVYISGTASINNKGKIVHPGDVRRQTARMMENVEALLGEAECSFDHVDQMIVYLRDPADYEVVKEIYESRFPLVPTVFVNAFVCRPGWLIEMECIATKEMENALYPVF